MRGVTFSNFAAKKFDSQKVDHGPTLSLRIFIRFARKNSPSGNRPLVADTSPKECLIKVRERVPNLYNFC